LSRSLDGEKRKVRGSAITVPTALLLRNAKSVIGRKGSPLQVHTHKRGRKMLAMPTRASTAIAFIST
jgi:hypothetical protein